MIVQFYVNVRFNLKLSQKSLNPKKSTMNNEFVFIENEVLRAAGEKKLKKILKYVIYSNIEIYIQNT